jgi:hypothetical protein
MDQAQDTSQQKAAQSGLGAFFEGRELKTFFSNYLMTIAIIEGLIFLVAFISGLSSPESTFPWKAFIFASFAAPLALTFIFAVVVQTFNRYLLHTEHPAELAPQTERSPEQGRAGRFLALIQQVPFLLSLLLLLVACWIGYNMDAIMAFVARAGESTARYLLITLGLVVGVAGMSILTWLGLSYRLRRKKIEQQQKYRQEVMERLGLVILEDNTVLDRQGRPVHRPQMQDRAKSQDSDDIPILPRIGRD